MGEASLFAREILTQSSERLCPQIPVWSIAYGRGWVSVIGPPGRQNGTPGPMLPERLCHWKKKEKIHARSSISPVGSCYAKIQSAVNAALPNDVINVAPGTHIEDLLNWQAAFAHRCWRRPVRH